MKATKRRHHSGHDPHQDHMDRSNFLQRQPLLEEEQEAEPFISSTGHGLVQPKLTIGAPNDSFEQAADRMADFIMSRPDIGRPAPTITTLHSGSLQRKCTTCESDEDGVVQRKCAKCEAEESGTIQRQGTDGPSHASGRFENRLHNRRGRGNPLSPDVQQQMEGHFDADFSDVRVHTDSEALQLSKEMNAQAFTYGTDIYFNQGKYDLVSISGKRLLAHELTHVVQQEEGNISIQRQDHEEDSEQVGITPEMILPADRIEESINILKSLDSEATLFLVVDNTIELRLYNRDSNLIRRLPIQFPINTNISGFYSNRPNIGEGWAPWAQMQDGPRLIGFLTNSTLNEEERGRSAQFDRGLDVLNWFNEVSLSAYLEIIENHSHIAMVIDLRETGVGRQDRPIYPTPDWARPLLLELRERIQEMGDSESRDTDQELPEHLGGPFMGGRDYSQVFITVFLQIEDLARRRRRGITHEPVRMDQGGEPRSEEELIEEILSVARRLSLRELPSDNYRELREIIESQHIIDRLIRAVYQTIHNEREGGVEEVQNLFENLYSDFSQLSTISELYEPLEIDPSQQMLEEWRSLFQPRFRQLYHVNVRTDLKTTYGWGRTMDHVVNIFALLYRGHYDLPRIDIYVEMGRAILPFPTRDDEAIDLLQQNNEPEAQRPDIRERILSDYNHAFYDLGHGNLENDLRNVMSGEVLDKARILLHRNLTNADQLYLHTLAISNTEEVEAIQIFQSAYDEDPIRFTGFMQLITNWNKLRHEQPRLVTSTILDGMENEDDEVWGYFEAIWDGYQTYQNLRRSGQLRNPRTRGFILENIQINIAEQSLNAALTRNLPSGFSINDEQVFRAISELRRIYRERLDRRLSESSTEEERERIRQEWLESDWRPAMSEIYRRLGDNFSADSLSGRRVRMLLSLEGLSLADEIYLASLGASSTKNARIAPLFIKAWQQGRLDQTIDGLMLPAIDGITGEEIRPARGTVDGIVVEMMSMSHQLNDIRRVQILVNSNYSLVSRGRDLLNFELTEGRDLPFIDEEWLVNAYRLLNANGISDNLRIRTLNAFVHSYIDTNAEYRDLRTYDEVYRFLNYLIRRGFNTGSTYFDFIQLLDPPETPRERLALAEARERAEHTGILDSALISATRFWDSISGEDTIEITEDYLRQLRFLVTLSERTGVADADLAAVMALYNYEGRNLNQLIEITDSEFRERLNRLSETKRVVADTIAIIAEVAIDLVLTAGTGGALGPALFASVASTIGGMIIHEGLLGDEYELISDENFNQLLISSVGTLLSGGLRNTEILERIAPELLNNLNRVPGFAREALREGLSSTVTTTLSVLLEGREPTAQDIISILASSISAQFSDSLGNSLRDELRDQHGIIDSLITNLFIDISGNLSVGLAEEIALLIAEEDLNYNNLLERIGHRALNDIIRATGSAISGTVDEHQEHQERQRQISEPEQRALHAIEELSHSREIETDTGEEDTITIPDPVSPFESLSGGTEETEPIVHFETPFEPDMTDEVAPVPSFMEDRALDVDLQDLEGDRPSEVEDEPSPTREPVNEDPIETEHREENDQLDSDIEEPDTLPGTSRQETEHVPDDVPESLIRQTVEVTNAQGEEHGFLILSDGRVLRCSKKCLELATSILERSDEVLSESDTERGRLISTRLNEEARHIRDEATALSNLPEAQRAAAEAELLARAIRLELEMSELELANEQQGRILESEAEANTDVIQQEIPSFADQVDSTDLSQLRSERYRIDMRLSSLPQEVDGSTNAQNRQRAVLQRRRRILESEIQLRQRLFESERPHRNLGDSELELLNRSLLDDLDELMADTMSRTEDVEAQRQLRREQREAIRAGERERHLRELSVLQRRKSILDDRHNELRRERDRMDRLSTLPLNSIDMRIANLEGRIRMLSREHDRNSVQVQILLPQLDRLQIQRAERIQTSEQARIRLTEIDQLQRDLARQSAENNIAISRLERQFRVMWLRYGTRDELYAYFRDRSPSLELSARVREIGRDEVYDIEVPSDQLSADHIIPVSRIVELPGFNLLPLNEQMNIMELRDNMMAVLPAVNSSRGDGSYEYWPGLGSQETLEQWGIPQRMTPEIRLRIVESERNAMQALHDAIRVASEQHNILLLDQ